jgi:hypothetical protein
MEGCAIYETLKLTTTEGGVVHNTVLKLGFCNRLQLMTHGLPRWCKWHCGAVALWLW